MTGQGSCSRRSGVFGPGEVPPPQSTGLSCLCGRARVSAVGKMQCPWGACKPAPFRVVASSSEDHLSPARRLAKPPGLLLVTQGCLRPSWPLCASPGSWGLFPASCQPSRPPHVSTAFLGVAPVVRGSVALSFGQASVVGLASYGCWRRDGGAGETPLEDRSAQSLVGAARGLRTHVRTWDACSAGLSP